MAETSQPGAQLTGKVPFFKQPEALDPNRHGGLGLRRVDGPFSFAREAHVAPVTVAEFGVAAINYPIIFVGEAKTPVAVMGLREGRNLFVDAEGKAEAEAYMPAFIRRYPFTFAEDKQNGNFVVCIDAGAELVTDAPDVPFFENGAATAYTNEAIEFLKGYEQQRRTTQALVEMLVGLDLFEEKTVNFQPRNADGSTQPPVKIADYFALSIEKLHKLPDAEFLKMRDNGALTAIYVHNASLLNWERLITRAVRLSNAEAAAAPVAPAGDAAPTSWDV